MGYCVNCLFQGDNNLDEQGNGRVFCMITDNESCESFTEYADLSKEIRSKYEFEIRDSKFGNSKVSSVVKQNWKAMIIAFITAFFAFIAVIKFFDRYIF